MIKADRKPTRALVSTWPLWLPPLIDAALIGLAFVLAHYARYTLQWLRPVNESNIAPFEPFIPYVMVFGLWLILWLQQRGMYHHLRGRIWSEEVVAIANGAATALVVITALSFFLQPLVFSRLLLLYGAIFSVLLLAISRAVYGELRRRRRKKGLDVERVLVVGVGEIGRAVLRNILARPDLGLQLIGFVDDDPDRADTDLGRVRALGTVDALPDIVDNERIDLVISALSWEHHRKILAIVRECERRDVQVRIVPDMFQLNLNQVQIENLAGVPLLGVNGDVRISTTGQVVKRAMDIALAGAALPFALGFIAIVAAAIRLEGPGPIFYSQPRVGKGGKVFRFWKFRTMVPNADELKADLVAAAGLDPRHPKLKDDPRRTRVGRVLRRFSLDELPQIFNILNGEMSIIGPRPPTPDEVALYEPWHRQRLQVRPGLTGLWQVSGRSDVPFEEMVLLDVYYIEHWSLLLDLQILLRTVPKVVTGEGAY